MRLRTLTTAVAGLLIAGSVFASGEVGVVNIQNVFKETPQGHASLLTIQSQMAPKVAELKKEQAAIEAQVKTVERNAPTMTKADRTSKEAALTAQQKGFQSKVLALRASEMKLEQTASKKFSDDLKSACAQVAQKDDYDVIITEQAAPYSSADADVTDAVIADMKSQNS